jgi:hypothetical protein
VFRDDYSSRQNAPTGTPAKGQDPIQPNDLQGDPVLEEPSLDLAIMSSPSAVVGRIPISSSLGKW